MRFQASKESILCSHFACFSALHAPRLFLGWRRTYDLVCGGLGGTEGEIAEGAPGPTESWVFGCFLSFLVFFFWVFGCFFEFLGVSFALDFLFFLCYIAFLGV